MTLAPGLQASIFLAHYAKLIPPLDLTKVSFDVIFSWIKDLAFSNQIFEYCGIREVIGILVTFVER